MINSDLILKQKLLPSKIGVYCFYNANKEVLYIGKAKNLNKRTKYYLKLDLLNQRLKKMILEAVDLNYYLTDHENEAFLLEAQLIKQKLPKYNIQYKHGRSFSYVVLTNHDYPQIKIVKDAQKDAIGPFLSYLNLKNLIQDLLNIFQLRTCSDFTIKKRKKPCLEYYSKKCSAPCVKLISKNLYNENVEKLRSLFYGKNKKVISKLTENLKEAIKKEAFEEANKLNNNIIFLKNMTKKQGIFFNGIKRLDIVVFYKKIFYLESIKDGAIINIEYRKYEKKLAPEEILNEYYLEDSKIKIIGDKDIVFKNYTNKLTKNEKEILEHTNNRFKKMLEEESEKKQWAIALELDHLETIESYDCSHYNSKNPLCAMIKSNIDYELLKSEYKVWRCKEKTYNDIEILEQGLTKRGSKNLPDLILIDGGLTQLNVAKKILYPYSNIIAYTKGDDRKGGIIYSYSGKELKIKDSKLLLFLEKLRTEAHNWAKNNAKKIFTNKFI